MIIKFSKIELGDWQHSICFGCGPNNETVESWIRSSLNFEEDYSSVALYVTDTSNVWELKFWHVLEFLGKFHDPLITGTQKEVTNYVDNFLIKMSGLTAFI